MTADAVGGVWRFSVDLAAALTPHGITTTLAVIGPAASADQRREAARAGIAVVENPSRLEWMDGGPEDAAKVGRWLLDLEAALRPDLIHLNGYGHAALPWRHPTVVVAHSCVRSWWRAVKGEPAPARYAAYARGVVAGLGAATAVVAPSAAMAEMLRLEYGAVAPVKVIANGQQPLPSSSRAVIRKAPIVLSAGRVWDEAKNVASLAAVAGALSWPVYIAGDTRAPDGELTELAGIHRLGRLSRAAMRRWFRRAAIYALPARYEPFGLSVLEAAAAGAALVLGNIPSLRENWDGAAVFVAPDDRQGLAAAIEQLIADDGRRRALGRAAALRAATFDISRTAADYVHLYESLVA